MPTKTQCQGVGMYAQYSFTLEHPDDHILELCHEGTTIARFSQTGATEESIQSECALHLTKYHGWDGVLWQPTE